MSAHHSMVQGMGEEALQGAIHQLSRNPRTYQDGSWESQRLASLKAESQRRSRKRRGKEAA